MQQIFPQRFFWPEFQFEISLKNIIDFKVLAAMYFMLQ